MPFFKSMSAATAKDDWTGFDLDSVEEPGLFDIPRDVIAFGADLIAPRIEVGLHDHRRAELLLTLRGAVTCEAEQGVWIAPPHCAVWIPGDLPHNVTLIGDVELYCLFIEPEAVPTLPRHCSILVVSPLLKQLVLRAAQLPELYDVDGPDGRLIAVLLDQLAAAAPEPLDVPMPSTPRLKTIADAIIENPRDRSTIEAWSTRLGVAPRTLTRMLERETGMSFGRWRQRLHIVIALQRLAQGASVQTVALDLGYEETSSFVTMFRKALGKPPRRYLAERNSNLSETDDIGHQLFD
ncbi:AraC family transcriptional regulator [Pseudochelatococcus sp. B33]